MKSLIKAGMVIGSTKPLRDVYIGIESNRINIVSEEEPVGFEDSDLIIGDWKRMVAPSFITTHASLFLFPFRFRIFSGKMNPYDLLSITTPNDAYYFSILASYHLLKTGVTTVVFSDPYLESVARGASTVGIRPIMAVGVGCLGSPENWEKEFSILYNKWHSLNQQNVILKICDPLEAKNAFEVAKEYKVTVLVDSLIDLSKIPENLLPDKIIALGGCSRRDFEFIIKKGIHISTNPSVEICNFTLGNAKPSISLDLTPSYDIRILANLATYRLMLTPEEAFRALTKWGYTQLGLEGLGEVSRNSLADLLVFSFTEPLSCPLDYETPYESLIFSGFNLETVLVNGEAILDGGVPLNVGLKDVEKSIEKVQEIDRKFKKPRDLMEKN
jgi:cytosine/adenosine deaminase-related metal-dependent hydrolase